MRMYFVFVFFPIHGGFTYNLKEYELGSKKYVVPLIYSGVLMLTINKLYATVKGY